MHLIGGHYHSCRAQLSPSHFYQRRSDIAAEIMPFPAHCTRVAGCEILYYDQKVGVTIP